MRICLTLIALTLLATPLPAQAGPPKKKDSLRKATRTVLEALLAGDRDAAGALLLTQAEMATITRRAPTKERYRKLVDRWLGKLLREFAEARKKGRKITIGRAHVLDVQLLAASSKLRRPVVFAAVSPTLIVSGKKRSGIPFFFIAHGGRWRLSIKK
jgi:hypothetical protein